MITLKQIRSDHNFSVMINKAWDYLKAKGYTEHGLRHVNYVCKVTANILRDLGHDDRTVELGSIAAYLHDIGNMHNRKNHGVTGANIVFTELRNMGMDIEDICEITTAIANHEEDNGHPVSILTAALILADKSDAHRTRVHKIHPGPPQIHDRVNLAIQNSKIYVDKERKSITLDIDFDQSMCQIMDFFEIYLKRMEMCKAASTVLGCRFRLIINGLEMLGNAPVHETAESEA